MLLRKKAIALSLILISCRPILGMMRSMRKPPYLLTRTSGQTFHFRNFSINTKPGFKDLSDEKLEQFLRNNYLSPENLPFTLANTEKLTLKQMKAINEFKQRQLNRKWPEKDKN